MRPEVPTPNRVEGMKKALKIDRELQDKYKKIFKNDPTGKEILGDLMWRFRYMGGEVAHDEFHTLKYAAQREVISWIITMAELNFIEVLERTKKQVNP